MYIAVALLAYVVTLLSLSIMWSCAGKVQVWFQLFGTLLCNCLVLLKMLLSWLCGNSLRAYRVGGGGVFLKELNR